MRQYELVLVIRPSVKDTEKKKIVDTVKAWLDKVNVTKEDDWGQKPLAYAIRHENAGQYYMLQFESEAAVPQDFEKRIITREDIIRHLLVRTD